MRLVFPRFLGRFEERNLDIGEPSPTSNGGQQHLPVANAASFLMPVPGWVMFQDFHAWMWLHLCHFPPMTLGLLLVSRIWLQDGPKGAREGMRSLGFIPSLPHTVAFRIYVRQHLCLTKQLPCGSSHDFLSYPESCQKDGTLVSLSLSLFLMSNLCQ